MSKADKQTLMILGGIAAVVGFAWWFKGQLDIQRQLENPTPPHIQEHYDHVNSIPEAVLYER